MSPGKRPTPVRPARAPAAPPARRPRPIEPAGQPRSARAGKAARKHRATRGPKAAPRPKAASPKPASGGGQILEVQFKGLRTDFFASSESPPLAEREYVVVEVGRGRDVGWVKRVANARDIACGGGCDKTNSRTVPAPSRRVIRRAAPSDVLRLLELRGEEDEVRRRTRRLVSENRLRMKVSEAEWQWDRNRLIVYFTAKKRVDFRKLVRHMARTFRTRVELRQISVRDEARRIGAIGRCRRELCCRSWLPSIEPVVLQLAKDQGLSLNAEQISGACGRLMNCLRYEQATYKQAKRRFPGIGQRVKTEQGNERVKGWDLFHDTISLKSRDGEIRTIPLDQFRTETRAARRSASERR